MKKRQCAAALTAIFMLLNSSTVFAGFGQIDTANSINDDVISNVIAYADSDIVNYAVTGGNIQFDKSTGTVTSADISVTAAVIPEEIEGVKVMSIGLKAFEDHDVLTSVTLPDSITTIGINAFYECSNLTKITLSRNLESIGSAAFGYTPIVSIDIPISVRKIDNFAFNSCEKLESIVLPEGLESIEMKSFNNCTSLKNVSIPDSVKNIGTSAFEGCTSLEEITLPDVRLYDTSTDIFAGCSSLTTVTTPNGLNGLPRGIFRWCKKLKNFSVNENVTKVGLYAFSGCESLTDENIKAMPDGIITIQDSAFSGCTGLVNPELPSSLKYINNGAFVNCANMTGITLPENVETVDVAAFRYCSSLVNVTLPQSLKSIEKLAFADTPISNISIPNGVESIDGDVFWNCANLKTVKLTSNLQYIYDDPFRYNDSESQPQKGWLKLYVPANSIIQKWAANNGYMYEIYEDKVYSEYAVEGGNIYIDENGVIVSADENITSADIPTEINGMNITAIGENAFSNCKVLLSVNIPESITAISTSTFTGCDENLVLYMPQNSYAAQFAKDNNLKYAYTDIVFVFGDADADNVVTASDAAFVLQKTLISTFELPIQKKTDDWLKYVDVDADTNITASDAAFILQKTLISTFELPAEKKYK